MVRFQNAIVWLVFFLVLFPAAAGAAQPGEDPPRETITFKPSLFNTELGDGYMYFIYEDTTPAEDRFLPPPRKIYKKYSQHKKLMPEIRRYNIAHNRYHQKKYGLRNGKAPFNDKERMRSESRRIHQVNITRMRVNGQTTYRWGSHHTDYNMRYTGAHHFYGLTPGKHIIQTTLWLESGYRIDGSFAIFVDPPRQRETNHLAAVNKSLEWGQKRVQSKSVSLGAWTGHLKKLMESVPLSMAYQGKHPADIQTVLDDVYALVQGILTFEQPKNWRAKPGQTWESYRLDQYHENLTEYAKLICRHGGSDRLWEALSYARQLESAGRLPAQLYRLIAGAYYSHTCDHVAARRLLQKAVDIQTVRARKNREKGLIFGTHVLNTRKDWPRALIPVHDRGPAVALAPPEETPEPEAPDSGMAEDALDRIQKMDKILSGVEERLQSGLIDIQLTVRALAKTRRTMRELSGRRGLETDTALQKKMQERINKYGQQLREMARVQDQHASAIRSLMTRTVRQVTILYEPGGFGEIEPHARERMDAALVREHLLTMQIALARGTPSAVIALARKHRLDYQMGGICYYMEGMAHLQNNDPASALDTFRMARERNLDSPGKSFEAMVRSTEIRILRTLQRMSELSARQFRAGFDRWIHNKAGQHLKDRDAAWSEYIWDAVANRGWYDTVSGVMGAWDAYFRAEETGTVEEQMARNFLGLNVLIELRKHFGLNRIAGMDQAGFKKALETRWPGRKITEDQAGRMRRMAMAAFQLDDVKTVAGGGTIGSGEILSKPLVLQLRADNLTDYLWTKGWETAADGSNALVNGWSVFTAFAPSAKLSMLKHSGPLAAGGKAARELENTASLGEWFMASAPMKKAIEDLSKGTVGRQILNAAVKIHDVSESGLRGTMAVNAGNIAAGYVLNHLVNTHLGKEAALALDLFSMLGGMSPEVYGQAFKKLAMDADDIRAMGQAIRKLGRQSARQADQVEAVIRQTRRIMDSPVDPAAISSLRQTVMAVPDLPPEATRRAAAALDAIEDGATVSARQSLADLGRTRQRLTAKARQAEAVADNIQQAATHRHSAPVQGDTLRRPAPGQSDTVRRLPPRQGDTLINPDRPMAPEPAGTAGSRPDLDDLTGQGSAASGSTGPDAIDLDDPATQNRAVPIRDSLPEKRFATDPGDPMFNADQALIQGDYERALGEYQSLLTRHDGNPELAERIREKLQMARQQQDLALNQRADRPEKGPRLHDGEGSTREMAEVEQIVSGEKPGAFVKVSEQTGGAATASEPWFVADEHGRLKAVVKKSFTHQTHPEGAIEEMASRFSERLGRNAPKSRQKYLKRPGQPAAERMLVTEIMPPGKELSQAGLSPAQMLQHRDEIAEDFIFSTFLGDGDRHFGNFRRTADGRLIPFDYGLADVLPEHALYRNKGYGEAAERIRRIQQEMDELADQLSRAREGSSTAQGIEQRISQLDTQLYQSRVNRLVNGLYHDTRFPQPPAMDSPKFRTYVKAQMRRHITHGTRDWRLHGGVLAETIQYGTLTPHLDNLKARLKPSAIDEVIDKAFGNGRFKAYTKKLLETRLDVMDEVLREFFPATPPASVPQSSNGRPVLFFRAPAQHAATLKLAA